MIIIIIVILIKSSNYKKYHGFTQKIMLMADFKTFFTVIRIFTDEFFRNKILSRFKVHESGNSLFDCFLSG